MFRPVVLLVLAALFLPSASAQPINPPSLNQAIERAAKNLEAGGIVAAEVRGDEVHYYSAGHPAPRTDVPPEQVIFEIGSITKVFTSMLLASTVREGKAALDDPISKFLPSDVALDPATASITLAQLASHTSGLPRLPNNFSPAQPLNPYADYSVERLYDFLRNYRPEQTPPQPVSYSNLGTGLLGHVLELIHGKSFETLVTERIAGPLGMKDTVIKLNDEQKTRFADPYSGSVKVLPWELNALTGAGALRSTAADLAKFAQALHEPTSPIHADWQLISTPRAPLGQGNGQIGLGILIGKINDQIFYNHAGGTGGYRTILEIIPPERRATIVLINNDTFEPAPIARAVRRLGRPAAPATPAAAPGESAPSVALAVNQLDEFTGVYALNTNGRFTFVRHGDQLMARLTGQPFLPLESTGPDTFINRRFAAEFRFARDANSRIDSVALHQHGSSLPAKREDTPTPPIRFLTEEQLGAYAGKYRLNENIVFDVAGQVGHLFVKITGQQAMPVFCLRDDHFVYDVVEAAITFERDDAGKVTALVLHQNGLDQRAPRVQ